MTNRPASPSPSDANNGATIFSRAILRQLMESLSDAVFLMAEDDTYLDCNDIALEMLGATRGDVIGSGPWAFSPKYQPDGLTSEERARSLLARARLGARVHHEWLHTKRDGTRIYNDVSLTSIRTEESDLVLAIVRDWTDLERANRDLRHRIKFESRLAHISSQFLNAPPERTGRLFEKVLKSITIDFECDRINLTWFASERPEFGQHFSSAADTDDNPNVVFRLSPEQTPWCTKIIKHNGVVKIDDVGKMPAEAKVDCENFSKYRYSSVLCLPLVVDEKIRGAFALFRHEQKSWENQAVAELQLLASAMANAFIRQRNEIDLASREKDLARSQAVAGVGSYRMTARHDDDPDSPNQLHVISLSMSPQALKIFGIGPQEDSRAQIFATLGQIHPDDQPQVLDVWRETLRNHSQHVIEYRVMRPDKTVTHVQARESVDSIDYDGVMTIFGTYKDITQWVESNQDLRAALSEIETLKDQLQEENVYLRKEVRVAHNFDRIIGEAPALKAALAAVEQVAPTDVTVLVTGETGTGKELISQSIHDLSDRKDKPIVSVNCAALSTQLIESELFGHEKGAFTGAHGQRKGRFELADGGTLFLDEIGEISGQLQVKLLRVIQEGEFERLGGSKTLRTDVRIIAATNRDLQKAVDKGEFRADLYYRINSFPIYMPTLRERKDDIALLTEYFVHKHAARLKKNVDAVSARTFRYFRNYDWPGNVRELEGTIQRALISTTGNVLDYVDGAAPPGDVWPGGEPDHSSSLLDAQREYIVESLERSNWVIEGKHGAAKALGLAPSSLRSKMKRLNIARPS